MKRMIVWIRHGQSDWNAEGRWQGHTDTRLSELGKRQAQALAQRLSEWSFDEVFSSDLKRARLTAELALPHTEHTVDSRLREINFGFYEGKVRADLDEEKRRFLDGWWVDPYDVTIPDGESLQCVHTRVQEWYEELPRECTVAVFTHGGVIRNALWQVVGPPKKGSWSASVDNTSLSIFEYTDSRVLIRRFNDASHLKGLS